MTDAGIPTPDETAVSSTIEGLEGIEDVSDKRVLSATDEQVVASLPAGSALLIVQRGPSADARFSLDTDRIAAEHHPRSNIFLNNVVVSRKHCELLRGDGKYLVHDTGSLSGTCVDHVRVELHLLAAGKEVQIGKFRLAYYPAVAQ